MMKARVLLVLLLVLGAVSAPIYAQNLVVNGDFENSPVGLGVADSWLPYEIPPSPPANYQVVFGVGYSGQNQMWECTAGAPYGGGIFQPVTGLYSDVVYEASVYFCDSTWMLGPTLFQIGIEQNGLPPQDPGASVVWSSPAPVTPGLQQATVEASPNSADASVVLYSTSDPGGGPGYPNISVVADKVQLIPKYRMIASVDDFCQLAADGTNNNYCGPVAAVNITEYWDVVMGHASAANVNAGQGKAACHDIAYWMDTNDAGCPYRYNGCGIPQFPSANGTYVGDLAPGIAQFARWDAAKLFGCTPPPAVPAGKNGYAWTVQSFTNNGNNLQGLWNLLVNEISLGRPLLVTWSYWNLDDTNHTHDAVKDIDFYEWGAPSGGSDDEDHHEDWNDYDPTKGSTQIGHIVTAVGYWTNYDPDGAGNLPKDNWVICHDTWDDTPTNVAIPMHLNVAQQTTAWAANTTVRLVAPAKGALTEGPGNKSPKDHWGFINKSNVMIQLTLQETSGNEAAQINAVKLTAMGTGDDKIDITSVDLWDDANGDGKVDGGDTFLATSGSGYPADNGTMTITIPGPTYNIAANSTRNMLVVYWMNANGSHGDTYKFITPTLHVTGATSYQPITPNVLLFLTFQKKLSTMSLEPGEPCPRIPWWKTHDDGTWGTIRDCTPIISCEGGIYGNTLYVQEDDRTGGIMIDFGDETPPALPTGMALEFEAYIDTVDGERVLVQPTVLGSYAAAVPKPVGMASKYIGGGDWQYNPATGAGQKGILDAYGLNNIGLLVKTCGLVTAAYTGTPPELSWFKITDGSPAEVKVVVPLGMTPRTPGEYVSVAGICSCEESAGDLLRLIKVRTSGDIKVESP